MAAAFAGPSRGRPPHAHVAALCIVAVIVLGLWLISPRFDIEGPSLIDDWASLHRAPPAVDALLDFEYVGGSPPEVDSSARYRPAFTAVWNSLQWRTFGAPGDLTGPDVWNGLRLILFALALAAIPLAVIAGPMRQGRDPGRFKLALAAAPPALVLCTPALPVDFARFGPQEPLLLGGMGVGGLLLLTATARAIEGARALSARVLVPAVMGYLLWLLGVYFKEASICFLVLAPFLLLFLNRRWREAGLIDRPLWLYRQMQVALALMVAPIVHVLAVVARIANKGTTAYGTEVASGVEGFRNAFEGQWDLMTTSLGTSMWRTLALLLPVAILLSAAYGRRVPWLSIGFALTAWAILVFQGLGGATATRYYIPVIALFAVSAVLVAIDSPTPVAFVALVASLVFMVDNAGVGHDVADNWAAGERAENRLVEAVAALNPAQCPVYQSGLDIERETALPILVEVAGSRGRCSSRFDAVLAQAPVARTVTGPLAAGCAAPGWRPIRRVHTVVLFGCARVKGGGPPGDRRVVVD